LRETESRTNALHGDPIIFGLGRWASLFAVLAMVMASSSGCQSFNPLRRHSNPQAALARQWNNGGLEALQKGSLKQAKSCFSRAVQHDPNDQYVHANLARAVARQGELELAIHHMSKAVELSHNDPRLIVELGEFYLSAGQWQFARQKSESALNINHRYAPAWALKAKTTRAKGQLDQALTEFQRAAGLDPTNAEVQMAIVETYQQHKQPMRALSAVEQLLSQYPPDQQPEEAILAKSVALMDLNQLSPAIEMLQTASRRDNASSEVFLRLGQAQLLAGQVSAARLTLTQAKSAFPGESEFDSLLAQLQTDRPHVAALEPTTMR
jgi:Tfp pilus assembly protein PilF